MADLIPDYLLFVLGLILLLGSAEVLVRNAVALAGRIGKSSLFVGLTVAAFGTSAPELAIGITGQISERVDVAMGNIVGSNIFNIFFVLGLTALVRPLVITRPTLRRDIPILLATCILFFLFAFNGGVDLIESLFLVVILTGYLVYISKISRQEGHEEESMSRDTSRPATGRGVTVILLFLVFSIVLLMIASDWMVTGAVSIAAGFGMSHFVIGLTIVAMGTSLPEIATTVAAVRQNQHELALGNVMGSCFFNIVAVPATMALISLGHLTVSYDAIAVDIPVMIMAVMACMPIFLTGHRMSRPEGVLFLIYYAIYVTLLYFRSVTDSVLAEYDTELILLALPIFVVTIAIISIRALKQRRESHERKSP